MIIAFGAFLVLKMNALIINKLNTLSNTQGIDNQSITAFE